MKYELIAKMCMCILASILLGFITLPNKYTRLWLEHREDERLFSKVRDHLEMGERIGKLCMILALFFSFLAGVIFRSLI